MLKSYILENLGPFADPATEMEIEETSSGMAISMIVNGEGRSILLDATTERFTVAGRYERQYASLGSLLASAEFADLKGMASTQVRVLKDVYSEPFLEPKLAVTRKNSNIGSDLATFRLVTDQKPEGATRIVLLDGPAGIGKTRLLERLTFERARDYLVSQGRPILYVGSKGRRMSNLPDTLAAATQVVRTRFTFDQVPALVRLNLLDLAIDGFDELVDADGYRDAWFTLFEFLTQLRGSGSCVLAARDTFFDQESFLSRLESKQVVAKNIELVQAHLSATEPEQAKVWLAEQGWTAGDVEEAAGAGVFDRGSYALRPYFLSEFAKAEGWREIEDSGSPRAFLITRFVVRESRLISEKIELDEISAKRGVDEVLMQAALDMAERESVEIDVDYLSVLCELVYGQELDDGDLRKLKHKVSSLVLLERASARSQRQFPHSEVRYHFLAHGIVSELAEGRIPVVLRRGVLGSDFLDVFQDVGESVAADVLERALQNLERAVESEGVGDRLGLNGGAILMSALSLDGVSVPSLMQSLQVGECSLRGVQRKCKLRSVSVFRLGAKGADLSQMAFDECEVAVFVGDSLTKFGTTTPLIRELCDSDSDSILRIPKAITEWIADHQTAKAATAVLLPFEEFFERVCRRAQRQFYFRYGADDAGSQLLDDELWKFLEPILETEGWLRKVTKKQTGGTASANFLHIKNPRALLDPTAGSEAQRVRAKVRRQAELLG